MNYIKQLQAELAAAKATQVEVLSDIIAFKAFLSSAKFTGTESDGSRKDWIATGDVNRWLSEVGSKINEQVHG